jgi:hypothetical protein
MYIFIVTEVPSHINTLFARHTAQKLMKDQMNKNKKCIVSQNNSLT